MKIARQLIATFCFLLILGILYSGFVNEYILLSTESTIISNIQDLTDKQIDCILVLGAGVEQDKPSLMLEDRLKKSIELYNNNISDKILMSGDHGREDYDEVNVMKSYVLKEGIPSKSVFMDHAGFSTYESIYRAKAIFSAKKIVIVSQKYHLPRALYIAKSLGLEAYGVAAEEIEYSNQNLREIREFLARNKDFIMSILKPIPKYLGKTIPVYGDGDLTND